MQKKYRLVQKNKEVIRIFALIVVFHSFYFIKFYDFACLKFLKNRVG